MNKRNAMLCGVLVWSACGEDVQHKEEAGESPAGAIGVDQDPSTAVPTSDSGLTTPGLSEEGVCGVLSARIRDFRADHPDFESFMGGAVTSGIVESRLGIDGAPVYAPLGGTQVTSGADAFEDWFHDRMGVNEAIEVQLMLEANATGNWVYDNPAYFPVDGQGFGNQGLEHNFHFTSEIRTEFTYRGGEHFTFSGDDDVWVFINQRLAIDLGGVHEEVSATVLLDERADELGIARGERYQLDVFHAERHTIESHFRMETSIDCIVPVLF